MFWVHNPPVWSWSGWGSAIPTNYTDFMENLNNGTLIPWALYQIEYRNYWRLNYSGLVEAASKPDIFLVLATGVDSYSQIVQSSLVPWAITRWDAWTTYAIDNTYLVQSDFIDDVLSPVIEDQWYGINSITWNVINLQANMEITWQSGEWSFSSLKDTDTLQLTASGEGEDWLLLWVVSDLATNWDITYTDYGDGTVDITILKLWDNFNTPFIPTTGTFNVQLEITPETTYTPWMIIRREDERGIVADFDWYTIHQRTYDAEIFDNSVSIGTTYLAGVDTYTFDTGVGSGQTIEIVPDVGSYSDRQLIKWWFNVKHLTWGDPFDNPWNLCFSLSWASRDFTIWAFCENILFMQSLVDFECYECNWMVFLNTVKNTKLYGVLNLVALNTVIWLSNLWVDAFPTALTNTVFLGTVEDAMFTKLAVENYFVWEIRWAVFNWTTSRIDRWYVRWTNILVGISNKTVPNLNWVNITLKDGTTYWQVISTAWVLTYQTIIA